MRPIGGGVRLSRVVEEAGGCLGVSGFGVKG